MVPCRAIFAAATFFLIGVALAIAHDPQSVVAEKGKWKIIAPAAPNAMQDKFALSTPAIDQSDASFRLSCRSDPQIYYFAIQDTRLAELHWVRKRPSRYACQVRNRSAFKGGSRGDGSIVIQERI
jgi:hypothetical protein